MFPCGFLFCYYGLKGNWSKEIFIKTFKLLFTAAVFILPLCAAAQTSGQAGQPRVGTESTGDDAPAAKPQARKKRMGSAVPVPGGESQPAKKEQAEKAPADITVPAGEDLNEAGEGRFEKLRIKSRVGSALGSLSSVRSSLMIYYGDTEGEFPPDLKTLVPKQAKAIPELDIPGYSKTGKVVIINKFTGDVIRKIVRNTGGWLYIADKTSKHWGEVMIDSVKTYKGKPLYEY